MPVELYKAALRGDWDTTERILDQYPEARVAPNLDTVLHIAVGTGEAFPYLTKLVNRVTPWRPRTRVELLLFMWQR